MAAVAAGISFHRAQINEDHVLVPADPVAVDDSGRHDQKGQP